MSKHRAARTHAWRRRARTLERACRCVFHTTGTTGSSVFFLHISAPWWMQQGQTLERTNPARKNLSQHKIHDASRIYESTSLEVPLCLWCQHLTTRTLQESRSSIKSSFADKDLKKLKQIEEQFTTPERKSKAKFWRKTLHSSLNFRKGRSGFCSSGSWLPVPEVVALGVKAPCVHEVF